MIPFDITDTFTASATAPFRLLPIHSIEAGRGCELSDGLIDRAGLGFNEVGFRRELNAPASDTAGKNHTVRRPRRVIIQTHTSTQAGPGCTAVEPSQYLQAARRGPRPTPITVTRTISETPEMVHNKSDITKWAHQQTGKRVANGQTNRQNGESPTNRPTSEKHTPLH